MTDSDMWFATPRVAKRSLSLLCCLLTLWAAGCVRYHPKPISSARSLDEFEARRLDSAELKEFLLARPGIEKWPPDAWDLQALTLAAIYYHPDMDVARAQWGIAVAGRITAGERPNPTGHLLMGYNSTTPVSEVTPWIPEASLEIPIETADKRGYRIAQARHLSESARLNIISTAWEVRSRLRQAYLNLYGSRETAVLLARQQSIQEASLKILEAQLAVGEVSPVEVTQVRIALDQSRLAAFEAEKLRAQAGIQLAGAVGVPLKALDGLELSFSDLAEVRADLPAKELRRRALLSRADILGALSEYEAAQSALRVEIARQYPDLNLGPDYQLDQTDSKWTLGLSLILPLLSRNKGPIAEAEARRAESAAKFLALQAKVVGEVDSTVVACQAAVGKAQAASGLLSSLKKQEAAARVRYESGEISKLELLGIQMEIASTALARLDALVKAQEAVGELEDALQSPLDLEAWALKAPAKAFGQAKERIK